MYGHVKTTNYQEFPGEYLRRLDGLNLSEKSLMAAISAASVTYPFANVNDYLFVSF